MSDARTSSVAFVRHHPVPPASPPARERGVSKWLRENLFSSIPNGILTILSLLAVYWILANTLPWILNGVWAAGSLSECREILQGTSGACWAVLAERWNQLLFGFTYPSEAYWRPTLAFLLLFVSAAPVLFPAIPRKLTILTAIYPFLAFFLIWGGSIWVPLLTAVGFVLGYLVYSRLVVHSFAIGLLCGIGAALVFWALQGSIKASIDIAIAEATMDAAQRVELEALTDAVSVAEEAFRIARDAEGAISRLLGSIFGYANDELRELQRALDSATASVREFYAAAGLIGLEAVPSRDLGGFMLNMILGTVCISLSLPIGVALALGRQSSMPIIKWVCVIFIEFVRGVPLITLLFVANVVLAYFLPPGTNFDLVLRVIIMITMFASAYIAEAVRGGLAALPRGQYEAANSLGLDYAQAMRLIILPQALKISIPGIVNVAVGLFKDTTLVSIIAMFDLVGMIRGPILASTDWNGVYWELFGFAALLFFVVCYTISQYSQWLERQLQTDRR